jgi:hypothetical protein
MSQQFTIVSAHGGARLAFTGVIPRDLGDDDACSYQVRLVGGAVEARLEVYDLGPQKWSALFEDMARQWRGWDGLLEQVSIEGHVRLSCTGHRTGQIEVRVELNGDPSGADWVAADTLYLEAGHLDALARQARQYFG